VRADPALDVTTEQNIAAKITRASEVINELNKTSTDVKSLMCRLKEDMSENDLTEIQNQLRDAYKEALCQDGVSLEMATPLVSLLAQCTVYGILIVLAVRGKSIIIYLLCNSVKALYHVSHMITSGFMRKVFADIIESETLMRTTVDVCVNAEEFSFRLSCIRHKGLLFYTQLLVLRP